MPNRRYAFSLWFGKIPRRKKWQLTPVLPEKSHGQRSLVGYSPWGHKMVRYLINSHIHLNLHNTKYSYSVINPYIFQYLHSCDPLHSFFLFFFPSLIVFRLHADSRRNLKLKMSALKVLLWCLATLLDIIGLLARSTNDSKIPLRSY